MNAKQRASLLEDLRDTPLAKLATLITVEITAPIRPVSKPIRRCVFYKAGQDRPKCLPPRVSGYCIRCLAKVLFENPASRALAKEFYDTALSIDLMTSLVRHMSEHPKLYKGRRWETYSMKLSDAMNAIAAMKSKNAEQIKALRSSRWKSAVNALT